MKHPPYFQRAISFLGSVGVTVALTFGPATCQALGQSAPRPSLSSKVVHHPKPALPTNLKPGHSPQPHHLVERGPLKFDADKYTSNPQQTIQGFRQ